MTWISAQGAGPVKGLCASGPKRLKPTIDSIIYEWMYSRTTLIRINWDDKPSGYADNPHNWIFLWKI